MCAGVNDAGDREGGKLISDGRESEGSSGVAGKDDVFRVVRLEEGEDFADEAGDGVGGLGAIGNACGVAEVEDIVLREGMPQGPDDGKAAEAGVEDDNGRRRRGHLRVGDQWSLSTLAVRASEIIGNTGDANSLYRTCWGYGLTFVGGSRRLGRWGKQWRLS